MDLYHLLGRTASHESQGLRVNAGLARRAWLAYSGKVARWVRLGKVAR